MPGYPITIDLEIVQIGTAAELAVALDVLQGQYDRIWWLVLSDWGRNYSAMMYSWTNSARPHAQTCA